MVIKAKLIGWSDDNGYIKYVFENIDKKEDYIVCTKFPGWETKPLQYEEKGYLEYKDISAGVDMWYNAEADKHVKYRYNMIQFIDFIKELPLNSKLDNKIRI